MSGPDEEQKEENTMKNMFDLTGKKAIVTGAAQGLAHGMAEGLMEAGAEVAIIDLSAKIGEVAGAFCARSLTECCPRKVWREEGQSPFLISPKEFCSDLSGLPAAARRNGILRP